MSNKKNNSANNTKKKKHTSYTPLWVKIVAIGCAIVILGTAIPLTVLFFH